MASLVLGAGILLHSKVQNKKEAKREQKRLEYEARFRELEQAHVNHRREKSGAQQSVPNDEASRQNETTSKRQPDDTQERKVSLESQRRDNLDSPAQWVDEVVKERSKGQRASQIT